MTTRKHQHRYNLRHGWHTVRVEGDAKTRGFQHGAQLSKELRLLLDTFPSMVSRNFGISLDTYIAKCVSQVKSVFQSKCKEWAEELEAICMGALSKGVVISLDFLLSWNLYLSMFTALKGHSSEDRCSAFIATGEATTRGQIVMAHNTHCDFVEASFFNVVMHVHPPKGQGHAFVMQTGPGLLCSATDWFISKSGLMGCETTIGGFTEKPEFGLPYFCRIRECMQYGNSLDDYKRIMMLDNAGDYACGWLFGDMKTGEIMLLELGLHHFGCERTKNGVFYGSNGVHNDRLREAETKDGGIYDIETSVGARNLRLAQLLREEYYGRIDTNVAKRVIGDHEDVYLGREKAGYRSICKHGELEAKKTNRPAHSPFGAIDGKVTDTALAKKMRFLGIWGSSCGKRVFRPKAFTRRFSRFKKLERWLPEFRREPWVKL
jgi:hypothetical protein